MATPTLEEQEKLEEELAAVGARLTSEVRFLHFGGWKFGKGVIHELC